MFLKLGISNLHRIWKIK